MAGLPESGNAVLDTALDPIRRYFDMKGVEDIIAVRPCEVMTVAYGKWTTKRDSALTADWWRTAGRVLANVNTLPWDDDNPAVSCRLPGGHRFEMLAGPTVESGLSVAIRLFAIRDVQFSGWGFTDQHVDVIREAVTRGDNVVICGGTGSGKTTLTNLMVKFIRRDERILIAEDTAELRVDLPNMVRFVVPRNKSGSGERSITYAKVFDHAMRARPDRLLLGELSTRNSLAALRFMKSGHKGFMTTVHANSVMEFLTTTIWLNIAFSDEDDVEISELAVEKFLTRGIDLAIQVNRTHGGKRTVTEIVQPSAGMKYLLGEPL